MRKTLNILIEDPNGVRNSFSKEDLDTIFGADFEIKPLQSSEFLNLISEKKSNLHIATGKVNEHSFLTFLQHIADKGLDVPFLLVIGENKSFSQANFRNSNSYNFSLKGNRKLDGINLPNHNGIDNTGQIKTASQITSASFNENSKGLNEKSLLEENKELKNEIKELRRNLRKEIQANKLKQQVVSAASHEFRTPLANILTSSSLILKYCETNDHENICNHGKKIQSAVYTLLEILNDYLSMGKLEEGVFKNKPEPIQIVDFVKAIINENLPILKNNQKVNYTHLGGDQNVAIDNFMFKSVIINVLSNSVKFSEKGMEIEITTRTVNKILEFKIRDHGIGIPKADQLNLFKRFYRASNTNKTEGIGLGLCIVKNFVELMGGNLSIDSDVNNGTLLTINIPVK